VDRVQHRLLLGIDDPVGSQADGQVRVLPAVVGQQDPVGRPQGPEGCQEEQADGPSAQDDDGVGRFPGDGLQAADHRRQGVQKGGLGEAQRVRLGEHGLAHDGGTQSDELPESHRGGVGLQALAEVGLDALAVEACPAGGRVGGHDGVSRAKGRDVRAHLGHDARVFTSQGPRTQAPGLQVILAGQGTDHAQDDFSGTRPGSRNLRQFQPAGPGQEGSQHRFKSPRTPSGISTPAQPQPPAPGQHQEPQDQKTSAATGKVGGQGVSFAMVGVTPQMPRKPAPGREAQGAASDQEGTQEQDEAC